MLNHRVGDCVMKFTDTFVHKPWGDDPMHHITQHTSVMTKLPATDQTDREWQKGPSPSQSFSTDQTGKHSPEAQPLSQIQIITQPMQLYIEQKLV